MFIGVLIHAFKSREQIRNIFRLDADACICDVIDHVAGFFIDHLALDRQRYGALFRVFDRVIEDIDEDLLDTHIITYQFIWNIRRYIDMEFQFLFLGADPHHADEVREHLSGLIRRGKKLHTSRLDLTHIEYVIDKVKKELACRLDIRGIFHDLLADIFTEDHLI